MRASYRHDTGVGGESGNAIEDGPSLADFSSEDLSQEAGAAGPAESIDKQAQVESARVAGVTAAVDDSRSIEVPDFMGKTMRDVTETCLRLGLDPVLVGSTLATQQTPEAGARVRPGAKVTVQFGTISSGATKPRRRTKS